MNQSNLCCLLNPVLHCTGCGKRWCNTCNLARNNYGLHYDDEGFDHGQGKCPVAGRMYIANTESFDRPIILIPYDK